MRNFILEHYNTFMVIFVIAAIWDLIWKIAAMWKAANNRQFIWFVCLAVFNTVGILPIIYLIINKNDNRTANK